MTDHYLPATVPIFKCPLCRQTLTESTRDGFRVFMGEVRRVCRPCAKANDRNRKA